MHAFARYPSRYLRRCLAWLADHALRRLSALARDLGAPTALTGIPVSAAILTALPVVRPEQPLADVAQLFVGGKHRALAMVADGRPVAVVTRDDLARGLERGGPDTLLAEAPRHGVVTVSPSDPLADVLAQLRSTPDVVAVVVDRGAPVGLATADRLEAYLARG